MILGVRALGLTPSPNCDVDLQTYLTPEGIWIVHLGKHVQQSRKEILTNPYIDLTTRSFMQAMTMFVEDKNWGIALVLFVPLASKHNGSIRLIQLL